MSKTLISVLIVGVVVVGGYFILRSNTKNNEEIVKNGEENTEQKKMAFSEFVKQGGSYKCEVKQSVSDMENSGTVYLSGNKMRGEFSTIAEGKTMDTLFIMRDGYSYTWSSTLPNMGFKMKVMSNTDTTNTNIDTSGNYSWNTEQIGDYNCEAWSADESMFTLPANITFQELGNK